MLLEPASNDELVAPPPTPVAAEATRRAYASARRLGLTRREFLRSTFGTALALSALVACDREERTANRPGTGAGGDYDLPDEAGSESDAAAEALAPGDSGRHRRSESEPDHARGRRAGGRRPG